MQKERMNAKNRVGDIYKYMQKRKKKSERRKEKKRLRE